MRQPAFGRCAVNPLLPSDKEASPLTVRVTLESLQKLSFWADASNTDINNIVQYILERELKPDLPPEVLEWLHSRAQKWKISVDDAADALVRILRMTV
jgi:hypothetical protein